MNFPKPKAEATLKVELSKELIERILVEYVKKQFPQSGEVKTVRFQIDRPVADMRGEYMGPHTLGNATVELSNPL